MKRYGWRTLLLASALVVSALSACGGGSTTSSSTSPSSPAARTGTVAGTVFSSSNVAIASASLAFGSVTASTDATGAYALTVPAATGQVITITKSGFAEYIARVDVTANAASSLPIVLTPIGTSTPLSITTGGSVSLSGSTGQVTLPANGLVDAITGNAATGTVTVNITEIDPAQNSAAMPSGFMARTAGGTQAIETFGLIQVDLRSSTGSKLQLAAGKTATIRIPVNAGVSNPPATAALFYLNETTGLWGQEGTASLVGSGSNAYYEATVSHFSYWSVGQLISTVYVSGCVRHADNSLPSSTENLAVVAIGTDYIGSDFANVAVSTGAFRVAVKANAEAEIQLVNRQQEFLTFTPVTTESTDITLGDCLVIPEPLPDVPVIGTQPQSQTIAVGASATLSVALSNAANAAPITYQWYAGDDALIANATQASYITPVLSNTSDSRSYYVIISNEAGEARSNTVTVSANTSTLPPSITTPPANQTVFVGDTATFSVALSATPPTATYQWLKDGAEINGATAASYTTPVLTLIDSGKNYNVRVTNSNGTVTSASALLTVNAVAVDTTEDAAIRQIARFVLLNTIADDLGAGFNMLVNNGSTYTSGGTQQVVLPSVVYDPFFCSPNRGQTIQVNAVTLAQYERKSFAANTTYALSIQMPTPACVTSVGGVSITGTIGSSFSYTGTNTPQNYNYTHAFDLSNASITLPTEAANYALLVSGKWRMVETSSTNATANTSSTERTLTPQAGATVVNQVATKTATVSAGQLKTTVSTDAQGNTTTVVTYLTPANIVVSGVTYTASGQYTVVITASGSVSSRTGSLLLKRNGTTVAEVYPDASGTGYLVKANGVESDFD